MKKGFWIGLGIGLAATLVLGSLAVAWTTFASSPLGWNMGKAPTPRGVPAVAGGTPTPGTLGYGPWNWGSCGGRWYVPGIGPGMMRSWGTAGAGSPSVFGCMGGVAPNTLPTDAHLSLDEARQAVEQYLERNGLGYLQVREVMEFTRNFYAIVEEPDTGKGAMELLVDRWTGLVGPEMGPNMMWNTKYGMMGGRGMGGMMGYWGSEMRITPEEATRIAQEWLDLNLPGTQAEEHADAFYGYYTLHTLQDGRISGMLSVHGTTGQVWYHTWHGDFVAMIGADED